MGTDASNETDQRTKKAWEKNWENISMEDVMGIFRYVRVKKQMEIFTRVLPKNGKILEGGCGLAPYLIKLRQLGFDVIGVDYNRGPIEKVLLHDPSLPVSLGDVARLQFPDGYFEGYLSLGVIEHFSEGPQQAIREAHRVLKRRGVFVVVVPIRNIFMDLKAPLTWLKKNPCLRQLFKKPEDTHYWEQYFRKKALADILENAGFEVKEVHALDHSHSLVAFMPFFRNKQEYDEATPFAIRISEFLERRFPWQTASQMTLVCIKK